MALVLKNIMASVVMNKLKQMEDDLDYCQCPQCRLDIASYVLNRVPPRYVASTEGEILSMISAMETQPCADVGRLIIEGARLVGQNPHHPPLENNE